MCPVCWVRSWGSAALIKLTWEKNIVSNWSLTRFCVARVVESSSTVPTTAGVEGQGQRTNHQLQAVSAAGGGGRDAHSNLQHSKISTRPNTWTASAMAALH